MQENDWPLGRNGLMPNDVLLHNNGIMCAVDRTCCRRRCPFEKFDAPAVIMMSDTVCDNRVFNEPIGYVLVVAS